MTFVGEWRKIPFAPWYEASRRGRVRNRATGHILSTFLTCGHRRVNLTIGGRRKPMVSHCVLYAFRGPPPSSTHTADHIDPGRKLDDSLRNLRWATKSQQAKNRRPAERNAQRIRVIQRNPETGEETLHLSMHHAAKDTGIGVGSICLTANGKQKTAGGFEWRFDTPALDLPGEEWRAAKNEETGVWTSNYGRVMDTRKGYTSKKTADEYRTNRQRADEQYPTIRIKGKIAHIHLLVAEAWDILDKGVLGKDVVDHVNGDIGNAAPTNLRCVTGSENSKAAYDAGSYDNTKVARKKVRLDGKDHKSITEAAEMAGVTRKTITDWIKKGSSRCQIVTL